MLNVEFVKQFAEFGAILAGFSMAIAFSLLLHNGTKPVPPVAAPDLPSWVLPVAAGAFLMSALVLVLGELLAAWVLSIYNALPKDSVPPPQVVSGAEWVFYLTIVGALALLVGIAISGRLRSIRLGAFTVALSILALVGAILLSLLLSPT